MLSLLLIILITKFLFHCSLSSDSDFCPFGYYNSFYLNSSAFSSANCLKTYLNPEPLMRMVLVVPAEYNENLSNPEFSVFSVIYDDLATCFANETFQLSMISNSSSNLTINFLAFDYQFSSVFPRTYFRRIKGTVTIQTLDCNLTNISGCMLEYQLPGRIQFKDRNCIFFVSESLKIKNVVFDGSQIQNNQSQELESGLIQIEYILDDFSQTMPILEIYQLKVENFINSDQEYFIMNDYNCGSILINNITFDFSDFQLGTIAFFPSCSNSELIILNSRIQKNVNNESSCFLISTGTNITLKIINLTLEGFGPAIYSFYVFIFYSLNQPIMMNSIHFLNINDQRLILLDSCSLNIKGLEITNSWLGPYSISIINKIAYLSITNLIIIDSDLIDPATYFLINKEGTLFLYNFLFDNLTNFQLWFVGSNSFLSNGKFSNMVAKRILVIDSSVFSLKNITFDSVNVTNSLMLFYTISAVFLDSLKFYNATSLSCILEAQNVNSIEIINTIFVNINTSYFLSPMALSLLKFTNYSLSWLSCYRGFYVTVSLKVIFTNVFMGYFTSISGPYFFQLMKISGEFYSVVFQEIYGFKMPFTMFHLSGGTVKLSNCSVLNVGWKTNDTSIMFSIDDNAVFYFFNEKSVLIESCVMISFNLSIHTGFLIYTGGAGNLTVINCLFMHAKHPELFAMGLIIMGAVNLALTNNIFIGLICPNSHYKFSRFQHINGPVAILGEAIYSRRKNNRIANFNNNRFCNCSCTRGGSFSIINYENVNIKGMLIENSYSIQKGGSFEIVSVAVISIVNIKTNNSTSFFGAVGIFLNIDNLTLSNSIFLNSRGKATGCFEARNTRKILINGCFVENATTEGNGAFLMVVGFLVEVSEFSSKTTNSNQGLFYITEGADFLIMNSSVINSFSSESGGFLAVDLGKSIILKSLTLINMTSSKKGGSLIAKSLEYFSLETVFVAHSSAGLTGVNYFKCSNQSAYHEINNFSCFNNEAKQGSCIYFDSDSPVIIKNINMSSCFETPLFFSSALKAKIYLKMVFFYKNQFSQHLLYIENVVINISETTFMENTVFENPQASYLSIVGVSDFRINSVNLIFDENNHQINKLIIGFKVLLSTILVQYINTNLNDISPFSFIVASSSSIVIAYANVKNIHHPDFSNGMITLEDSSINVTFSNFSNNLGPLFYGLNSNISVFYAIINTTQNIGEKNSPNEFYIENLNNPSYFVLSHVHICGFNGKSMMISSCSEIFILSCYFVNLFPKVEFQAMNLKEISSLTINSTSISGFNYFGNGGAISLKNSVLTFARIFIALSEFTNNIAFVGGAIYIESNAIISFLSTTFSNNSVKKVFNVYSGIAAAIYIDTYQLTNNNNKNEVELKNNYFTNNTADEAISDIFSSICFSLTNNSFSISKNTSQFLSFPFFINIVDHNNLFIKPGQPFKVSFQLVDCHSQVMMYDSSSIGNLNSKPLNKSLFNTMKSESTRVEKGILTFSNVEVNIEPGSSFIMSISLNLYNIFIKTSQKLQNSFIFPTINCSDGEILLIDKSCYACPNGSYSSNDFPNEIPNICLPCPENAQCQRNLIIPDPGYWRGIRESTLIVHCLIPDACTGEYVMNANGSYTKCIQYHQGNLCDVCQYGYGKYTTFSTCQECKDINGSQIGRAVAILVLVIIYILMNSKSMIKSDNDSITNVVFKILINHIQRISIIIISEIQISLDFKSYFVYFNYMLILTEDTFSNDCFVQLMFDDISKIPFYKILMVLMLPIIIACLCFLIFSLIILKKSVSHDKKSQQRSPYFRKSIIYFLVCSFLCYSMLINCSFKLLNCIPLSNDPLTKSQSFLYDAPNFQCWVGWHRYGAFPSGIAGIVIWGICFPLFLWKIIKMNLNLAKSKVYTSNMSVFESKEIAKKGVEILHDDDFRFFTKEYKKEYYYWESIVFIHKLLLNIFAQMSHWSNEQYLRISNVLFLLVYFSLVHKLKPFAIKKVNFLEYMSLITAMITNLSSISISSYGISPFLKYIIFFVFILLNILFFVKGIQLIIRNTNWKEMYFNTQTSFRKLRNSMKTWRGKTFSLKLVFDKKKEQDHKKHLQNSPAKLLE